MRMFSLPPDSTEKLEPLITNHNLDIRGGQSIEKTTLGKSFTTSSSRKPPRSSNRTATSLSSPTRPLWSLNFENADPPAEKPHYWLETVNIEVAPSLILLQSNASSRTFYKFSLLPAMSIPASQEKLLPLGHEDLGLHYNLYSGRSQLLPPAASTSVSSRQPAATLFMDLSLRPRAVIHAESVGFLYFLSPETNGADYRLSARDLMKLGLKADLVSFYALPEEAAPVRIGSFSNLFAMKRNQRYFDCTNRSSSSNS